MLISKKETVTGIGTAGFGFKRDENGFVYPLQRTSHDHNVIIGEDVEIGNFTTIDRGSWRDTQIHYGTKIDSNVKVAHNVIIGKHCLIVANVTLCGSCEIGDYCYIGAGAEIKQHIKIADHVTIGMGAVVLNDITQPNSTWVGNPARKIADVQKF